MAFWPEVGFRATPGYTPSPLGPRSRRKKDRERSATNGKMIHACEEKRASSRENADG